MQRSTPTLLVSMVAAASLLGVVACGSRTTLGADETGNGKGPTNVTLPSADENALRCVSGDLALTRAQPDVMFLVDRSGSMEQPLGGGELGTPKWDVMWGALSGLVTSLDGTAQVGVKFFPDVAPASNFRDPTTACRVAMKPDVEPARAASSAVLDAFSVTVPGGGTPTAAAVDAVVSFFRESPRKGRARYIVLATDGAPTCNEKLDPKTCVCTSDKASSPGCTMDGYDCLDDHRAVSAVRRAITDAKIPVYVLGLGNPAKPEFVSTLEAMAVAGGRARPQKPAYYEAKSSQELFGSLVEISKSATRCTYEVASRPNDPNAMVVRVDGAVVPRDVTRAEGWDWVDRDFGQIGFFGAACDRVSDDENPVTMAATVRCQ